MLSKINLKRVLVSAVGVFLVAFVAAATTLPDAIGSGDWSTAKDVAWAAILAGVAAVVEAVFHVVTTGFGDPTAPKA